MKEYCDIQNSTNQHYNITNQHNKKQNNIVALKRIIILLQNNITRHNIIL